MRFDVITLFPEFVRQVIEFGIAGRAFRQQLFELECWNPRDFTSDVHRTVDHRPYGGGPGMVMMYPPLEAALKAAQNAQDQAAARVVYMSPQGKPLDQTMVNRFASMERLILISGRYEGIDERFIEDYVDEECSVGDYVLSGGELPVMTLVDAVTRQLPGVLGHKDSARQDSFMDGWLDCPHYTRPEVVHGRKVPDVLLSGNHAEIALWRKKVAQTRTQMRRPDLLESKRFALDDPED